MVNPIGRNYPNNLYQTERERGKTARRKTANEAEGVIVNISHSPDTEDDFEKRVEKLKKLVKEGKYPLDRDKLAEKILQFLTDVG